jgi:hypothetical protein
MQTPRSTNQLDSEEEYDPEKIVLAWCEEITRLYKNFNAIQAQTKRENQVDHFVGQCPVGQLVLLASILQDELANLMQDLDLLDNSQGPVSEQHFKQLAAHTALLRRLNQQAGLKLKLAALPAC